MLQLATAKNLKALFAKAKEIPRFKRKGIRGSVRMIRLRPQDALIGWYVCRSEDGKLSYRDRRQIVPYEAHEMLVPNSSYFNNIPNNVPVICIQGMHACTFTQRGASFIESWALSESKCVLYLTIHWGNVTFEKGDYKFASEFRLYVPLNSTVGPFFSWIGPEAKRLDMVARKARRMAEALLKTPGLGAFVRAAARHLETKLAIGKLEADLLKARSDFVHSYVPCKTASKR